METIKQKTEHPKPYNKSLQEQTEEMGLVQNDPESLNTKLDENRKRADATQPFNMRSTFLFKSLLTPS